MHTEIFNNIDILIKMADSTNNIDDISTELITLKKEIDIKKNEIEDLTSLITESRYFDASLELVDKNIEISLKNKITRLNKKIKALKNTIEEIKETEKSMHSNISSLKNKLSKNSAYIKTLEVKVQTSTNNSYYKDLLESELANVKLLEEELNTKEAKYQEILKNLELNNQALVELNTKLSNEKQRLSEVEASLTNPNSYIDEDLKQNDNKKLDTLNKELAKLESRKIELLTDASMIAADAKEFVASNNAEAAIDKIKELVTIVKAKPYMDVASKSLLEEELDKKESERSELSNLIDSKNYNGFNSNAIQNRIGYLNKEIAANKEQIDIYQNRINVIDDYINNTLGLTIKDLEKEIYLNETVLNDYRSMYEDKSKSVKIKANLENAITKKEKEKKVLDGLLLSYKENMLAKIAETNTLNDLINTYKSQIEDYSTELENLEKLTLLDFKTKDLIEEEHDKDRLKALTEEIKTIQTRLQFDKSPDEIYDEIEMAIAAFKPVTPVLREDKNKDIDSLFDVSTPEEILNNRIKVIEMIPVEAASHTDAQGGN